MLHQETKAIRRQMDRTEYREHSAPLFLTSSFTFPNAELMRDTFSGEEEGIIYSRYNNPNVDEFIRKVCEMEEAEDGFATASGMAAVFVSMAALLRSGDHILASKAIFGSTIQILEQIFPLWGITHTFVDPLDIASWEKSLTPNTRMVVLETPANPGLQLVDLEEAARFTKTRNLILNVDNCFATPYLQRPIPMGANLSVHSATKWMDGQGRALGGIVVGDKALIERIRFFSRHTGPSMSPFNAWIFSKSLETLAVRMDRHCSNALQVASFLEEHKQVVKVNYPFLASHPQYELAKRQMEQGGGIVSFEVKGGLQAAMAFLNGLQMITRSSNLGDTRSIATHPATTTHSKLSAEQRQAIGITDGLIRISVGLEHVLDILQDIDRSLRNIGE